MWEIKPGNIVQVSCGKLAKKKMNCHFSTNTFKWMFSSFYIQLIYPPRSPTSLNNVKFFATDSY